MKVSLLLPTYKDAVSLELILESLTYQTYKNFEVIVAEDAQEKITKNIINKFKNILEIKHISHKDIGNRKAIILNKALVNVSGEYLIFIDGDTIAFSNFIKSHVILSKKKQILCGRRVNLGDKVSSDLRNRKTKAIELERNYFKYFFYLNRDNIRHYEQGIYINPKSIFYKLVQKFDTNLHIVGSNFSCFKQDLVDINGFDEDIVGGSKDDVDLEWRFIANGCKLATCKFSANLFHLNHSRVCRKKDIEIANKQMELNKINNKYFCKNGLNKYKKRG